MPQDLRPGTVRRQAWPDTAANDNVSSGPLPSSVLPPDARAIIETMPVATNQSGRARSTQWRLRFAPRSRPFVDPLTGWTGGCDPLAHVVLRFPSLEAAELYCRLQQLRFEVRWPTQLQRSLPTAAIKPDSCNNKERTRHA